MKTILCTRFVFLASLLLAVAVVLAIWVVIVSATFSPQADASLSDTEHGVNADIAANFNIPAEDYQYARYFSFTPEEFFPTGGSPPAIGAQVGDIHVEATLGLLNGACNVSLPVTVELLWASTDVSDTITPFAAQFADADPANGVPDGADHYPDFLTRIIPGATPIERHFGWAVLSGQQVSISIVTLPAGSLGFPSAWGRPSVTVLNDIGDPAAEPQPYGAISDFCAPLSNSIVTFGLASDGAEVRHNPDCEGTFSFRWYAESMIDGDGDGYENYIDTCPLVTNIDPSPKTAAGDPDGDGIDRACEPAGGPGMMCWPGAPGFLNDCDSDGFYNRGDNCPLVANPNQADADADDIGDACDPNPTTPDGTPIIRQMQVDIDITGGPICGQQTPTVTPVAPVGGITELERGRAPLSALRSDADFPYVALAAAATAAALLALTIGACYARRRWLDR